MASKKEEKSMAELTNEKEVSKIGVALSHEEKLKNVKSAIGQIEKLFGKGSILNLGDKVNAEYPHIETGIVSFDKATGIGGLPRGRIIEIFGPESAGKTSFCLNVVSKVQKSGGIAAIIDVEQALDPTFATKLGVDVDKLLVSQPSSGEEALEICESLVRTNSVDVIVVDSTSALVPKAEIEGNMGDAVMGGQARLLSQAMRKLTPAIATSGTVVIFISQIRMKIGCVAPDTKVQWIKEN